MQLPVAAVLELNNGFHCWVRTPDGISKRAIRLGGSNDIFVIVKDGIAAGEEVILNPLAYIDDAQKEALVPLHETTEEEGDSTEPSKTANPPGTTDA